MTWRTFAACADSNPDIFFSEAETKVAEALAICATCPVTDECLRDAIDYGDTIGIRGGIHFNGRNQPKRPVGRPRKAPEGYEQCGSDAGYQTHQRRKEAPCKGCKEAHRIAVNEYRARRRRGAA